MIKRILGEHFLLFVFLSVDFDQADKRKRMSIEYLTKMQKIKICNKPRVYSSNVTNDYKSPGDPPSLVKTMTDYTELFYLYIL